MNGTGESFVTGFIFTYVQNIFLWPYWGGAIVPSAPMDPSLTGFQSEQVIYMLTTSGCQVDFASSTLYGSLRKTSFHTYVLPIDEQKHSAKSFSFGYFSSEANRQNSSLSRQLHGRHQQTIGPSRAEGTSTRQIGDTNQLTKV